MYVPDYFRPDAESVAELLRNHGAVDLVSATSGGLRSTMLPMVWIEPDADSALPLGRLVGHVARKNDHWRQDVLGEAMAIIRGPDAYVTPAWYETKRRHGRVVPTWNYVTAHVYGQLVIHDDAAWVEDNVRLLTAKHEAQRSEPWAVDDAPAPYVAGQLRAIVGMELLIGRIEAKFKLSQNRSEEDIAGVIDGLTIAGQLDMADAVRDAAPDRANADSSRST
jgi:transcriptional regulator